MWIFHQLVQQNTANHPSISSMDFAVAVFERRDCFTINAVMSPPLLIVRVMR
jgi:hypothetical protein